MPFFGVPLFFSHRIRHLLDHLSVSYPAARINMNIEIFTTVHPFLAVFEIRNSQHRLPQSILRASSCGRPPGMSLVQRIGSLVARLIGINDAELVIHTIWAYILRTTAHASRGGAGASRNV